MRFLDVVGKHLPQLNGHIKGVAVLLRRRHNVFARKGTGSLGTSLDSLYGWRF